jgi:hypothetical protein
MATHPKTLAKDRRLASFSVILHQLIIHAENRRFGVDSQLESFRRRPHRPVLIL